MVSSEKPVLKFWVGFQPLHLQTNTLCFFRADMSIMLLHRITVAKQSNDSLRPLISI